MDLLAQTFLAPRYIKKTSKESSFWSDITSRPDEPANYRCTCHGVRNKHKKEKEEEIGVCSGYSISSVAAAEALPPFVIEN
jgi:hypothetical protein